MTPATIPSRFGLACILGSALLLSACAEKQVILPGERESVRPEADLSESRIRLDGNTARAIQLPAQRVNAEWTQGVGSPAFRVDHAALGGQLQHLWAVPIGNPDSRRARITASPVVGGGLVYTLDSGAQVSAVTPEGTVAWSTNLTPASERAIDSTGGGLAYADGTVYISSGFGLLSALDARTGELRWRQKLEANGSGMPLVRDGIVYVVAGDHTGWAVDAGNGRVLWQVMGAPSVTTVLGSGAPATSSDLVVFGFGSGDLVAAFRQGGMRHWAAAVAGNRLGRAISRIGDVTGTPVIAGDRVFAGSHSGRLAAFGLHGGEELWLARQGALGPVWPAGDSVFAVTDLNQLARFDAGNGTPVWAVDLPGFVSDKPRKRSETWAHYGPILAGGRIITASNDGLLRLFSPESGQLAGQVEVPGGATAAPVVANRTLYVVSSDGKLHAYR